MADIENITMIPLDNLLMSHKHPLLPNKKIEKIAKGEVFVLYLKDRLS
jgi:hypothetical protein